MSLGPVTEDAFLDGRLTLRQPRDGYRAATDPVFLAACVPALPGAHILDLGCGAGAALFCLGRRVAGLHLHGLEIQPEYAALARENAALNGLSALIFDGDVTHPPLQMRAMSFDHVIMNPPFYNPATSSAPMNIGRDLAHREGAAGLSAFMDQGLRRLRAGGSLTIVHRVERLGEILAALQGRGGAIQILPLSARAGRPAKRVIVQALKGARGPLRLLSPLVVHAGEHEDAQGYTPQAEAVLRHGEAVKLVNTC